MTLLATLIPPRKFLTRFVCRKHGADLEHVDALASIPQGMGMSPVLEQPASRGMEKLVLGPEAPRPRARLRSAMEGSIEGSGRQRRLAVA